MQDKNTNRHLRSVSVVMCTYNGEKFLKEQLDSILRQTYPVLELIVQDDCSSDNTCAIVEEYAEKYPFIKLFRNEKQLGINQNFFSAMHRAQGELIAISDQDDIWENDKLEKQVNAIGNKMCCAGLSAPFATEKSIPFTIDLRHPNRNLLRLVFVGSIPGHCMLFTKDLLDETLRLSPFFPSRLYDVTIAMVAASHDSIAYVDSVLVKHRRHYTNSTKTYFNPKGSSKSVKNLFNTFKESWCLYRRLRPQIIRSLKNQGKFLSKIDSQEPILKDALKIIRLYTSRYFIDFIRLSFFCARRGHLLSFASKKRSFSSCLFGATFPIYSSTYYKFFLRDSA